MIDRVLQSEEGAVGMAKGGVPVDNPEAGRQVADILGHPLQRPRLVRGRPVRTAARPLIGQHQAVATTRGQRVEIVAKPRVVQPGPAVENQQREPRSLAPLLDVELGVRDLYQPPHRAPPPALRNAMPTSLHPPERGRMMPQPSTRDQACHLTCGQGAPGRARGLRSWSPERQKAYPETGISLLTCVGTAGFEPATP